MAVAAAVGIAAVTLVNARRAPVPDGTMIAREAGQAAAEQSGAVVAQLLDANRALMETERERSTTELDGKRVLIDARLESMNQELGRVTDLLREFESERGAKLDVLSGVLRQQREGIAELTRTTQGLARGAVEHQGTRSVGRADGRGRAGARRLRRGNPVPQAGLRRRRARDPGLHLPAPARRRALHGREVPARQLPPLPRRRVRARPAPSPRRLLARRARRRSRSWRPGATPRRTPRPSTASCCSSPTSSSTASSRSTTRRSSSRRSGTRS